MNIVFSENTVLSRQDAHGTQANTASLNNRLVWMREWEQALWAQKQQRVIAADSQPNDTVDSRDTTTPEHKLRMIDDAIVNADAKREMKRNGAAHAYSGTTSDIANINQITPLNRSLPNSLPYSHAPQSPSLRPLSALNAVSELSAPMSVVNPWISKSIVEWSPYIVHVIHNRGGLRIWVRDKQLHESMLHEILVSIRHELASYGVALKSLSINGKEVWKTHDTEHHDLTTQSETSETFNRFY